MHTIKLDLRHGFIFIDSIPIAVDEKNILIKSIVKLCSAALQTDEGRTQYRLLRKASVCGESADVVIEVGEGRVCAVTFLFDLIEFFESSVLESKVIKAFEKSLNMKFISIHPSTAFLNSCKWGKAIFFYDAKQGDLSLDITFQPSSNEPILEA